eukprot:scaffold161020_cov31-Tisochrysis_lutea.AAC.1
MREEGIEIEREEGRFPLSYGTPLSLVVRVLSSSLSYHIPPFYSQYRDVVPSGVTVSPSRTLATRSLDVTSVLRNDAVYSWSWTNPVGCSLFKHGTPPRQERERETRDIRLSRARDCDGARVPRTSSSNATSLDQSQRPNTEHLFLFPSKGSYDPRSPLKGAGVGVGRWLLVGLPIPQPTTINGPNR